MPEGPETHREAQRIATVLEGRRLTEAWAKAPDLCRALARLEGRRVDEVRAWGKAMLVRVGEHTLFTHNQLYGKWFVARDGREPSTGRDLRVRLTTEAGCARLYSASTLRLLSSGCLEAEPMLARLGPDALWAHTRPAMIRGRLRDRRFAGRSLAALLLDQSFLAGLGNYLRSEILFEAGLHHGLRPRELDDAAIAALANAIRAVPRRSLRQRGTVLDGEGQRIAKRVLGGRRRFWVFDRAGEPCLRCGTAIVRESAAGRRVYSCPRCQPAPEGG